MSLRIVGPQPRGLPITSDDGPAHAAILDDDYSFIQIPWVGAIYAQPIRADLELGKARILDDDINGDFFGVIGFPSSPPEFLRYPPIVSGGSIQSGVTGAAAITESPDTVSAAGAGVGIVDDDINGTFFGVLGFPSAPPQFLRYPPVVSGGSVQSAVSGSAAITESSDTVSGSGFGRGTVDEDLRPTLFSLPAIFVAQPASWDNELAQAPYDDLSIIFLPYPPTFTAQPVPLSAGDEWVPPVAVGSASIIEGPDVITAFGQISTIDDDPGTTPECLQLELQIIVAQPPAIGNDDLPGAFIAAGSAAITEAADTVSGLGGTAGSGQAAVVEPGDVVAGVGGTSVSGAGAAQESADVVSGSGILGATGDAAITEQPDVVSGLGGVAGSGSAAVQEGPDVVAGTGAGSATGSAAITEQPDVVRAFALVGQTSGIRVVVAPSIGRIVVGGAVPQAQEIQTLQVEQIAGTNQPYRVDVSLQSVEQWQANMSVVGGSIIRPTIPNSTGFVYENESANGQTGPIEPAWPRVAGGTVQDGSLTMTAVVPPSPGQDAIATVTWSQINPPDATLTIGAQSNTQLVASADIGGMTQSRVYLLLCEITMASGAEYAQRIQITAV